MKIPKSKPVSMSFVKTEETGAIFLPLPRSVVKVKRQKTAAAVQNSSSSAS